MGPLVISGRERGEEGGRVRRGAGRRVQARATGHSCSWVKSKYRWMRGLWEITAMLKENLSCLLFFSPLPMRFLVKQLFCFVLVWFDLVCFDDALWTCGRVVKC